MKLIFFSIIAFSMMGLIFPSGFSSTYVHETGYPFSIQYPSGWYIFEFPDDELGAGISIDSDKTGRNGFYITLMCSELRGDDCGEAGADYQEIDFLKEDDKWYCDNATFAEVHVKCFNYEIIDEYAHQLDGYRAFTIVSSYSLLQDGEDPMFPDGTAGVKFDGIGTTTYVLVGNDIWYIATGSEADKFDQELHETLISTFKINNVYAQEDIFYEPTWIENLINAIMSLFSWNTSSDTSSVVIETPMEENLMLEQNYDWDNPIIIELDPCLYWEC